MEREEYDHMYHLEDTLWWYVGMRSLTRTLLDSLPLLQGSLSVLDAGCGTGGNLYHLRALGKMTGVDFSPAALSYCRQRGLACVAQASVTALPFADSTFDLVLSFDVLYHLGVADDLTALQEFLRVLAPGGYCLVRLPAFQWLLSAHDRAVHTRQRYTAAEVRQKALAAGFLVRRITYLDTLLFPLAMLVRWRQRSKPQVESNVRPLPSPLNALLRWTLEQERHLLRLVDLPFGLSVAAILQKPRISSDSVSSS
jgi:SAM-dependent methyltransferase